MTSAVTYGDPIENKSGNRRSWDRAPVDTQRQRGSWHRLLGIESGLVYGLQRHSQRGLLSDGGSAANLAKGALGHRITNVDPEGRFRIIKEVIADPHQSCVLVHTRLEADADMLAKLRLFALLAPHLEVGGRGNNGNVVETPNWGKVLAAHKGNTWLVLAASVPFLRSSCGYVGTTDGWQDLAQNFRMDWEFDCALDGNIALIGEIDIRRSREFVLALGFSNSLHHSMVTVAQALGTSFAGHKKRLITNHLAKVAVPELRGIEK
jgi:hypothetical protein